MGKADLESRFEQALVEGGLVQPGEAVLAGVSGGADSVAMLHLFCRVARKPAWSLKLHVVHLNHGLRGPAADADAAFVADLCRHWRVSCAIERVDVAGEAAAGGISVEEAGRRCRLEAFERACLKAGIQTIALGHHADDNAETVLHRIVRGTGLRGLAGIRAVRPLRPDSEIRIIRPLLGFRRAQIEDFLREQGISWREDATNAGVAYTRNRIRNELLPLLRERFNPQVADALNRLAEQACGLQAYLAETAERMLDALVIQQDGRQLVLHVPPLLRKPRVIQTELIRRAMLRLGYPEGEATYAHLTAVADLAAGREGSKALHLPAGLRVSRRYTRLAFERAGGAAMPGASVGEVRVATEGVTHLPAFGLEIEAVRRCVEPGEAPAPAGGGAERSTGRYEECLDAEAVRPPLIARRRRPGDRFVPLGMTGLKKISDFLIDEKIEADRRDRVVLLCDQLGPIWVVPLRIDERVRLTRGTRQVLHLTARVTDPSLWPGRA